MKNHCYGPLSCHLQVNMQKQLQLNKINIARCTKGILYSTVVTLVIYAVCLVYMAVKMSLLHVVHGGLLILK